jgi:broad specificity phosphatase PhoE/N-acetylglutamate synthase-like GNAT family acetyltransferase
MRRIFLIRHAESENNVVHSRLAAADGREKAVAVGEGELARVSDADLSPRGQEQAEKLALALGAKLAGEKCLLVSSPMRRALQTATPLAGRLGLDADSFRCQGGFYEVGGCYLRQKALPGAGKAQIEAEFPVSCHDIPAAGWFAGHRLRESSEQGRQRVQRMAAWVESLLAREDALFDTLILVLHGDLLTRWLRYWLGIPWHRELVFVHGNTGISELAWQARGRWMLRGSNDQGHLPSALRTGHGAGEGWWHFTLPDLVIESREDLESMPSTLLEQVSRLRQLVPPESPVEKAQQDRHRPGRYFVALVAGKLAGYVLFDQEKERLGEILVHPSYRAVGLGLRLLRAVGEAMSQQGGARLRVRARSGSAGFFAKAGFIPCDAPFSVPTGEGKTAIMEAIQMGSDKPLEMVFAMQPQG